MTVLSSAPIYAHTDAPAADSAAAPAAASATTASAAAATDGSAWAALNQASDTRAFCGAWLAILCLQVPRVRGALVLLAEADRSFVPAAFWPDAGRNLMHLGPAAQAALTQRRGVVLPGTGGEGSTASLATHVAYPLEVEGELQGAVVLDLTPRPEAEVQLALRLLHWGSAWLIDHFRRQLVLRERQLVARLSLATDTVATALQEERLGAACLAVVNDLAARLDCQRVALGFEQGGSVRVQAISHTATFDARTDFVRLLAEAMDEVWDLDLSVVHPPRQSDSVPGLAHAALSAARQDSAVLSVPLRNDGVMVGALTFERARERPFGEEELALCEALGTLLGSVLDLKRQQERSWRERATAAWRHVSTSLFGPDHPGLKLLSALGVAVLLFFSLVDATYRVSAKTVVEGEVQRALAAPFQGFVAESFVRPGDRVRAGQPLARLDDRDLKLEQLRWRAEVEQAQRRYRQAAAASDRAAMAVTSAQVDQARAQLTLTEERIARALVTAPFDGIVVQGDLSQQLGSPVEQGKLLFEVAPLDAYRVILQVDERNIGDVQLGQRGELALSGLPYERLPFTVERITPISVPQDGRNHFRVEARLDPSSVVLRPGLEGIGKVEVGERRLIWIWTHPFVDWLRLWAWKWFG